ncbi:MAG: hypothetical protein ACK4M5_03935, partial [Dietzia cercidiphylli]
MIERRVVKTTRRAGGQGEIPNRRVVNDNRKAIPMKNSKRMMAVIAASGLALGSMPGVANAQGSADLGLGLGVALGDSLELGVDLAAGLGSAGAPGGTNSLEGVTGSLTAPGGSLDEATGSLTAPGGSL